MKLYDSLLPVSLVSRLSSSVLVILHRSSEAHLILFNIAFITLFWLFLSLFFLSQLCVPELVALITLWIPIGEFRRPTVTCSCVFQILAAGKLGIVWLPCGNCEGLQNIQFFFFSDFVDQTRTNLNRTTWWNVFRCPTLLNYVEKDGFVFLVEQTWGSPVRTLIDHRQWSNTLTERTRQLPFRTFQTRVIFHAWKLELVQTWWKVKFSVKSVHLDDH